MNHSLRFPLDSNSPVFVIAEIGINHNGDINLAKKLIDVAVEAGCNAVKFQKRNPDETVPEHYKNILRETPWGVMTYLEYRKKIEFWKREYSEIDQYCKSKNIYWSASCWDIDSLNFIIQYDIPFLKIPSALLTHKNYLLKVKEIKERHKLPVFLSTGMSDLNLVKKAVECIGINNLIVMHTISTYPAKNEEINLNAIRTLQNELQCLVGYSGHERGLQISIAAVAMGVKVIERHVTLDRSMWGTDHSASLEPEGLRRLIRDIRIVESAMGDGNKKIVDSERKIIEKLRKVNDL